jgi:5'-nucleotidase (lipoprotein e(P4) family)
MNLKTPSIDSTVAPTKVRRLSGAAIFGGFVLLGTLSGCAVKLASTEAAKPAKTAMIAALPPLDLLNAVLWQQTAAEYQAGSLQSFQTAQAQLELLLKQSSLTAAVEQTGNFSALPPAVIVDVDETMLDNSAFQARLITSGKTFVEADWAAWCREAAALPVPGAREFSNFANARGVRVIYMSNRDVSLTEPTRANLAAYGFSDAANTQTFLFRDKANGMDTKGQRRTLVAKKYRIVMLVGDNLGDFNEGYRSDVAARQTLVSDFSGYWGTRWIMLANPSYGSWEQTLYGFDAAQAPEVIRQKKLAALRLQWKN